MLDVTIGGDKKTGRAASRVLHEFAGAGLNQVDHAIDERTRREILSGATLTLLRVLFQQPFVKFSKSSFLARLEPFDGVDLSDQLLKMPRLPKGCIGVCENLLHTAFCFRAEMKEQLPVERE